ncbi:MAG: hypothetical protein K940chlam3_01211 [Chlamydiae bacterium]|nr:hypothetical protein [Chlamydiota bacterium]
MVFAFSLYADEAQILRRVQSHLLIHDMPSAYQEVSQGTAQYPSSKILQEKEIEVLALMGREKKMLSHWKKYSENYPGAYSETLLLEAMGWGVINKGFSTASPLTRAIALIAANLSRSAKGVDLLVKGTKDPNAAVRAIALELCMENRDARLQDRVLECILHETSWGARMAAMKAAGGMKLKAAQVPLRNIIESSKTSDEEKAIAVKSLVMILEEPSREDIWRLVQSQRKGLRLLACEIVAVLRRREDVDLIFPLLSDHSLTIRKAALQVLGILRVSEANHLINPMTKDPNSEVAMIASWALMLNQDPNGQLTMRKWLSHDSQEIRCFAAICLRVAGKYGNPLLQQTFYTSQDPYVRLNCAMGLIGQRVDCDEACEGIYRELTRNDDRWMWKEEGIFRGVAPSLHRHRPDIPQFPEVANQLVRLELLQLLAFLHYPHTQRALKTFLQERTLGITGVVVALMLSEGEEESLDLIRSLLNDSDPRVRAQAALILAIWGREEKVIKQLEQIYTTTDRSVKEKVLEGMGRIGSNHSIPFLVDRLSEPHQHLRMIAAAGIIQCVNH